LHGYDGVDPQVGYLCGGDALAAFLTLFAKRKMIFPIGGRGNLGKQVKGLFIGIQRHTSVKERKFFPDANSTLRVTYGKVKGSEPADAVRYHYQTTLDGVMEKYIPNDYEFDVPKKLIDLYNRKDYGIYKNVRNNLWTFMKR